jgi:ADP-ribose diphosphatase
MSTAPETGGDGPLPRWETLRQEPVADCRVFQVGRKFCRHPVRQREQDFFVIDSPDWVNVVARTTTGEIVLVNQFRFGTEAFSLEVPGGVIEAGEDPATAASRELLEETGFGGGEVKLATRVRPNPAIQSNWCHLVVIEGVRPLSAVDWDEHEEIQTVLLPVKEVYRLARTGGITHALSLTALFFYESTAGATQAGI